MFAEDWDIVSPFHQVGLVPDNGPDTAKTSATPGLSMVSPNSAAGHPPLWHPDNPLFWLGGLLAVTFGLIAVSTSVKVGPFKGSLSAGDPK